MTEAEWLAGDDLLAMLDCVRAARVSDRKQRLLACACGRLVWHLLTDARSRESVAVAEAFADGLADDVPLADAYDAAGAAWRTLPRPWDCRRERARYFAALTAFRAAWDSSWSEGTDRAVNDALYSAAKATWAQGNDEPDDEWLNSPSAGEAFRHQSELLRDLFRNPFRPAPAVDPAWLAWRNGVVRELARAAYDGRRLPEGALEPERLAVLADALEDAGCGDAELLGHLRGPGPHVRGCWVVDLVLGKE